MFLRIRINNNYVWIQYITNRYTISDKVIVWDV